MTNLDIVSPRLHPQMMPRMRYMYVKSSSPLLSLIAIFENDDDKYE